MIVLFKFNLKRHLLFDYYTKTLFPSSNLISYNIDPFQIIPPRSTNLSNGALILVLSWYAFGHHR